MKLLKRGLIQIKRDMKQPQRQINDKETKTDRETQIEYKETQNNLKSDMK